LAVDPLYRAVAFASEFYTARLLEPAGKAARDYLAGRGVSPAQIQRFGLGFAPDSWDSFTRAASAQGISIEDQEKAGLVARRSSGTGCYDRFRSRIMFSIRDVRGRPVGLGGRIFGEGEPKYLNSPETPVFNKRRLLYGIDRAANAARITKRMVLVEGYMDALVPWIHGFDEFVASLGTALGEDHARLIKRYCDEVIICYDPDAAGQKAALRGLDILKDAGLNVKVATVPDGLDPDEYLNKFGRDSFASDVLGKAVELTIYRIEQAAASLDVSQPSGRARFGQFTAGILAGLKNEIERSTYLQYVVDHYSIDPSALRAEVARRAGHEGDKTGSAGHNYSERNIGPEIDSLEVKGGVAAARQLLSLSADYFEEVKTHLEQWRGLDAYPLPAHKEILAQLLAGENSKTENLLETLTGSARSEWAQCMLNPALCSDTAAAGQMAKDCVRRLRRFALDIEVSRLQTRLKEKNSPDEQMRILRDLQTALKALTEIKSAG
jgi:DNA primase